MARLDDIKSEYSDFVKKVEFRQEAKKPRVTKGVDVKGSLALRNNRLSIREAALRSCTCVILYKKVTTDEINKYEVIPIEWKYKKTKRGMRKVLYAADYRDQKRIKMFVGRNIFRAAPTNRRVKSLYPILIQ